MNHAIDLSLSTRPSSTRFSHLLQAVHTIHAFHYKEAAARIDYWRAHTYNDADR